MSTPIALFQLRANATAGIRRFFAERGVLEAMTPVITDYGVTDPHIESVALTRSTHPHSGYLRTSPEYFHKRLLASGSGDLYELGPVFRAGEQGRHHRSEFCMLEWYRLGFSWRELAQEVIDLIQSLSSRPWKVSYRSWLSFSLEQLGVDVSQADLATFQTALGERMLQAPDNLDHSALLDWWFATQVQPQFPSGTLTVVYDYPAAQAALARLCPDRPDWAERFEVFAGPLELANGYHELTDADEQQLRFERDNQQRKALGLPEMPIDQRLLAALHKGLPQCSGIAMGFERLLMASHGLARIEDAVFFADEHENHKQAG